MGTMAFRGGNATAFCVVLPILAACSATQSNDVSQIVSPETAATDSVSVDTQDESTSDQIVEAAPTDTQAITVAASEAATVASCPVAVAGGPPPKPEKGADFAQNAVGKNVGRNVGRNLIANIGARAGGGLGGAISGGLARQAIRSEQDLDGNWTLTNGAPTCGCTIEISAGVSLQGAEATQGSIKKNDCTTLVAQATRWALGGRTFTGYNTKLTLVAKDRRTTLATLNRDGINYFSGQLADGTPVTMWRRGG